MAEEMYKACAVCHKVEDYQGIWKYTGELYCVIKNIFSLSHGYCPPCLEEVKKTHGLEEKVNT